MINYLAVLAAAVAAMVVGSLWYSPLLFGKRWVAEMMFGKKNPEPMKKEMISAMIGMFLGAVIMAYVLAYVLLVFGVTSMVGVLSVVAWLWLGFVVVPASAGVLFERRSLTLFLINVGNYLVTMIVDGIVLFYLSR